VGWDVGIRTAAAALAHEGVRVAAPSAEQLARVAEPELALVAARYRPSFGSMSVDDVARGRALVHDALAGLQVVPVVNRWSREGLPAAAHADAFVGTVHTLPPRNLADRAMRLVRRHWEQARGFYGPGDLVGNTVFASAQFVPRTSIEGTGGDAVAGLRELARERGNWGVARFGDRAHVLDASVLERASVTARDSGIGLHPASPATIDRLDDVVLERLARSSGFRRDPFTAASHYRIGIEGEGPASARRAAFLRLLHDTPHDEAVARLRSYLTSSAMGDLDHMVELQVRGVRERDVLATVPEAAAAHVRPVGI
jgi:hypothetical protein